MFDPGDRWEYGINIDFAGKMVRPSAARSSAPYLQENLFAPLGMDSTAFTSPRKCARRLAKVHQRSATDGTLAPIEFEMTQEPEFEMAVGACTRPRATICKFLRMMMTPARARPTRC